MSEIDCIIQEIKLYLDNNNFEKTFLKKILKEMTDYTIELEEDYRRQDLEFAKNEEDKKMKKFDSESYKNDKDASMVGWCQCVLCGWATTDEKEMAEHFTAHKKEYYKEED